MKDAAEQYETFVKNHPSGTVFQSRIFGEFQEKIPYRGKSWALAAKDATCLVIKIKLRFGKCWLWVPYGPLTNCHAEPVEASLNQIFEDLARIAKEEKAIFARIEPPSDFLFRPGAEFDLLKSRWRIVKSPQRFAPEHSLVLNLEKSEDEILAQMKPKGRYNIQVAKRKGLIIRKYNLQSIPGNTKVQSSLSGVKIRASADFDVFYEILKKTGGRGGFGIHPKYFYKTLLETLEPKKMASLFLAYHQDAVIGGIIVIFYKDTATYYYGASSREHRNLMAPYLLQWEAICEAKRRGMKTYDFLGIAPPDGTLRQARGDEHPWSGVTEFKKKFGGKEITHPPAFDVVYRPLLYRAMRLVQSCRR